MDLLSGKANNLKTTPLGSGKLTVFSHFVDQTIDRTNNQQIILELSTDCTFFQAKMLVGQHKQFDDVTLNTGHFSLFSELS